MSSMRRIAHRCGWFPEKPRTQNNRPDLRQNSGACSSGESRVTSPSFPGIPDLSETQAPDVVFYDGTHRRLNRSNPSEFCGKFEFHQLLCPDIPAQEALEVAVFGSTNNIRQPGLAQPQKKRLSYTLMANHQTSKLVLLQIG